MMTRSSRLSHLLPRMIKGKGVFSGVLSSVGASSGDFTLRIVWRKVERSSKEVGESMA